MQFGAFALNENRLDHLLVLRNLGKCSGMELLTRRGKDDEFFAPARLWRAIWPSG